MGAVALRREETRHSRAQAYGINRDGFYGLGPKDTGHART